MTRANDTRHDQHLWQSPEEIANRGFVRAEHNDQDIETAVLSFGIDRLEQIQRLLSPRRELENSNGLLDDINALILKHLFTSAAEGARQISPEALAMMETEGYLRKAGPAQPTTWAGRRKKRSEPTTTTRR